MKENKAVYTVTFVAGGWVVAVMIWARALKSWAGAAMSGAEAVKATRILKVNLWPTNTVTYRPRCPRQKGKREQTQNLRSVKFREGKKEIGRKLVLCRLMQTRVRISLRVSFWLFFLSKFARIHLYLKTTRHTVFESQSLFIYHFLFFTYLTIPRVIIERCRFDVSIFLYPWHAIYLSCSLFFQYVLSFFFFREI